MGSSEGKQNPWTSYETFRDCSQGICSRYCPQWCYFLIPPPPDFELSDDDSGTTFSPLIIATIGILASGFLLVGYYVIITRYCRRRGSQRRSSAEMDGNRDEITHDQWQTASSGLDETLIKSIAVCKYKKGDGLIEGTECAVCLNEFQENENLRLLPKCTHAFHLPCIDTWLKTHSNCPLCRCTAAPTSPSPPPPGQNSQNSSNLNVSSLQMQPQNDLVLVVEDRERSHHEELVYSLVTDGFPKDNIQANSDVENAEIRNNIADIDHQGVKHFRRSISLGTFSCRRHLLIADILKIDEDDDVQDEIIRSQISLEEQSRGSSSSRGLESSRSPALMQRSLSMERFMVTHHKGLPIMGNMARDPLIRK